MGIIQKNKLVLKDVASGNPKKIMALLDEKENSVTVGTIIGIASGIKHGKQADGVTPIKGLSGNFEGTPADPEHDTVQSGVCYLPEAFMNPIFDILEDDEQGGPVQFAAEVILVRAENAAGYSWALRPAGDMHAKQNDPLASLRSALPAPKAPAAIADQSKGKAAAKT